VSLSKQWLFLLAGTLWALAGAVLCTRAYFWLILDRISLALPLGLLGIALAALFYALGFNKIARKNAARIGGLPDKASVFMFTARRGYIMIALMMSAGIFLRSSGIPREFLAVLYAAMGGALLAASLQFFVNFWKIAVLKEKHLPSDINPPKIERGN